jgi:hypothetical protein
MKFTDLEVVEYRFPPQGQESPSVHIASRGMTGWVIVDGCYVFNKNYEWEYEPQPSNRTDDFIRHTRFATAQEAFDFFMEHRYDEKDIDEGAISEEESYEAEKELSCEVCGDTIEDDRCETCDGETEEN